MLKIKIGIYRKRYDTPPGAATQYKVSFIVVSFSTWVFVYFRLSALCGPWCGRLPRVANGVEGWSTCRPRGSAALYHGPQSAPASNTQFYQRGQPVRHRLRGEGGTCTDPLPAIRSRTESSGKWKGELIVASQRGQLAMPIWATRKCRTGQPKSA